MRAQNRTKMKPYEVKNLGEKPADRPDNSEAIRMCVNAWHQLAGNRYPSTIGFGPIQFTALVVWGEVNKLDRETFEMLCHVINHLDNERAIKEDSQRKTKGKKRCP